MPPEGFRLAGVAANLTVHESGGPLYMSQVLASAEHDGYTLEWTRLIPFGMRLCVSKDGKAVRTVILDERHLMDRMADVALDGLSEEGADF